MVNLISKKEIQVKPSLIKIHVGKTKFKKAKHLNLSLFFFFFRKIHLFHCIHVCRHAK